MFWAELAQLMVRPRDPEPTVHGVIRSYGSVDEPGNAMGWVAGLREPQPTFTGVAPERPQVVGVQSEGEQLVTVWRDGKRIRVETHDGQPHLITNGELVWIFPAPGQPALVSPARPLVFRGSGTHLLQRRTAADLAPLGEPTTPVLVALFLGRDAWQVSLRPAGDGAVERTIVVDAETGLVLSQRSTATGAVDEWTELTVAQPPLGASTFVYSGPSRNAEQVHEAESTDHEQDRDRRLDWFRARVTSVPLRAEVTLDLTVDWVHTYDEHSGAFEAALDGGRGNRGGALARRPRSTEPWPLGWSRVDHRWSTSRWDWALTLDGTTLTEDGRAAMQRQLGDAP